MRSVAAPTGNRLSVGCLWAAFIFSVAVGLRMGAVEARAAAQPAAKGDFCKAGMVRDLLRPLRKLPTIHELPASRRFPFGPPHLEVVPSSSSGLVVGADSVGLRLFAGKPARLEWTIAGRLERIDGQGRGVGKARTRIWTLGGLGPPDVERELAFRVGARSSLYRFDVHIKDRSGRVLGRYSEYFRVMPRDVRAGLSLSSDSYPGGATLRVRLEDRGTASLFYGLDLQVERWTGAEWIYDPASPKSWPLEGLSIEGGGIGACESLPLGGIPGKYRVTKMVAASISGREWAVRAHFQIVP